MPFENRCLYELILETRQMAAFIFVYFQAIVKRQKIWPNVELMNALI